MLNFRHVSGCIELNGASQVLKVKQMMKCFVWLALQSRVPPEPLCQQPTGGCSGCARETGTAAPGGGEDPSTRLWVLPRLSGENLFSF